jgi:hypothetical protein
MLRSRLALGLLGAIAAGCASQALAETYGYATQYPPPGSLRVYINSPAKKISSRFVAPPDLDGKRVTGIYVYSVGAHGTEPTCRVGLQADADGLPSAVWLTSTQFTPNGSGTFQKINVPWFALSANTAYHVVIAYESGTADSQNYVAFPYMTAHTQPEMSVLADYGSGWVVHSNADPVFAVNFSDGSTFGQPYTSAGEQRAFGSGQEAGFGEQVVLDQPMTVRRVSFLMRLSGWPTSPCRVRIRDADSGSVLCDELFCTASDFSRTQDAFHCFYWIGHDLSVPVSLSAGRTYQIWLYQDGFGGDGNNCYRIRQSLHQWGGPLSSLTWNGTSCCAIYVRYSNANISKWVNMDAVFRLDSNTMDSLYRHVTCVTPTSATAVVSTNRLSNVQVDYGETPAYGLVATSLGLTRHEVALVGLEAGKHYHYRITATDPTDPTNTVVTSDSEFRIPLPDDAVTVDVVDDMQQMSFFYTLGQALQRNADLLLTVGDNVELADYVTGTPATLDQARLEWQQFLGLFAPGSWSPAFYLTVGNHDNVVAPNCRLAWQEQLTLPTNGNAELYYSFDYGPAHFVVLDSITADGRVDDTQLNWLQQDLAAATKPWKIALIHVPVKGTSALDPHYDWWTLKNAAAVHNVFRQYGVHLVLQGHRHVYNRYVSEGVYYVTDTTPHIQFGQTPFDDETPSSGQSSYANTGGDPGTIPAYINQSGSLRLVVTPKQISVSMINAADQVADKFSVAPEEFHLSSPGEGAELTTATPVLGWTLSADDGSGLDRYELWIDGQLNLPWIPPDWTSSIPAAPLANGPHTWKVVAVNRAGIITASDETLSFLINANPSGDTTPPTNPTLVAGYSDSTHQCRLSNGAWYSYTRPQFLWNGATDENSGVVGYYVYFGQDPNADPVVSGTFSTDNSYQPTGLVIDGTYWLRIRTKDAAGNVSPDTFQGFAYGFDDSPPSVPGQPSTASPTTDLTPTWQWDASQDNSSGVAGYYVRVIKTDTQTVITNDLWVDNTTTWVQTPALALGGYTCTVCASDQAGQRSAWSAAGTVSVVQNSIAWARNAPMGTSVMLWGKIVSAAFDDCFYIEEAGRNAGIRVEGAFPLSVGNVVAVSGITWATDAQEPTILPSCVTGTGSTDPPQPLFMKQKNLLRGSPQRGLDTTGLLVCAAGRVTSTVWDGFYFDDGCALVGDSGHVGAKVSTSELPPGSFDPPGFGDFVRAAGVNSRYRTGNQAFPLIRCRFPSDLLAHH